MANERDIKYEGMDEESEYQFTDDQLNYELESENEGEVPTPAASTVSPSAEKKSIIQTIKPFAIKYRRILIGVGVFFVLLFLVYKMLTPNQTPPSTEFAPQNTPNAAQPTTMPTPSPAPTPTATAPQPAPTITPAPTPALPPPAAPSVTPFSPPSAEVTPPINPMTQPAAPSPLGTEQAHNGPALPNAVPPEPTFPQGPQMAPHQGAPLAPLQPAANPPYPTAPPSMAPSPLPQAAVVPPPPSVSAAEQNLSDKLTTLEEQNAKIMNLMQTQFAQKMAYYESQNKFLEDQVLMLNKRLANMEATLSRVGQATERVERVPVPIMARPPAPRVIEPKMIYTVQAIIPGRAWLKSEAGETVTVAEGDILKDYGRIVKIDPYDGIVQIDTGSKVITLTYGANG